MKEIDALGCRGAWFYERIVDASGGHETLPQPKYRWWGLKHSVFMALDGGDRAYYTVY